MHCSDYKNGKRFTNKEVLVVGCGNSGMEIAYDLWDHGAITSIVVRNPVHVVTKEMVLLGMLLLKYIPCKVVPTITKIEGDNVYFSNGKMNRFDAIIFATGYKSTVLKWLKESEDLFNEDGMPKKSFPNHWNGENGLYCVGFASRGLFGIARDAEHIANHIRGVMSRK
ncbi:putative indole-3-pyruvate monooxygenase YUCCA11 [Vitis vinifera]|uniref:indole-3-pyruvate monooxygenase n=1 Tax=Vitis vinifera TaxID=29760 RepID=A0A438J2V2_VITVI|nr:putative indole-3-pyruvate monooxygenase YUCCA11 [Vitis vinifera]